MIRAEKNNITDRQYWRKLLNWGNDCESGYHADESSSGLDVYTENKRKYIIHVTCTLGAYQGYQGYQGYQQFYHLTLEGDKTIVKALMFPLYKVSKKKAVKKELAAEIWGNVLNKSDYKNLIILNQYSGYGNCGTLTTYKIINGEVITTQFRSEPDCESKKASRDPDKWPEYSIPR